MRHFPIFLDLTGRRVLFSGSGDIAEPKIRLILKTRATVEVYGEHPNERIRGWAEDGRVALFERPLLETDIGDAALLYCASGSETADRVAAELGKAHRVPVNIVDNLDDSQFITPAIVDRDPVTVAIGTEGAAPVLARRIKSDLETRLPAATGALAEVAASFRKRASMIGSPRRRREFWARFFDRDGPKAWSEGGRSAARRRLGSLLVETLAAGSPRGSVHFIDAGPGDPDFLSVRAKRILEEADRIIHDPGTAGSILELGRREAAFVVRGLDRIQESDLVRHGRNGEQVVCLLSAGAASVRVEAFRRHMVSCGIDCEILASVTPLRSTLFEGAC